MNSDGVGPRFLDVDTSQAPTITVTTADPAKRVVLLYQPRTKSTWQLLELSGAGTSWTVALPASDPTVEFFVQAVDAQGDVSVSDNKVENFFNSGDPLGGPLTITSSPLPNANGLNNTDVTVTISAAATSDFDYVSLDGNPIANPVAPATKLDILVKGDGPHVIFARDSSGSGQIFDVTIDGTKPTITSPQAPTTPWSPGPVNVQFSAQDLPAIAGGFASGVASITFTVGASAPTTVLGASASVPVSAPGVTRVTAYATDAAGNQSAPVSVDVRIDQTAPTVAISATPAVIAPSSLWATTTNVTLTVPAPGAGESPIKSVEYKLGPATGDEPADPWIAYPPAGIPVSGEGQAVWAKVTDEANNVSAVVKSGALQIDRTAPVATLTLPTIPLQVGDVANATWSCTDALSGIKSPGGCVLSGAVNSTTGALDTSTAGPKQVTLTATDNAGNPPTIVTASYTVGLRTCELYDATKPANPGSNYTIKVQICDAQGRPTADNGKLVLTAIEVIKSDGAEFNITPNFSGGSNAGLRVPLLGEGQAVRLQPEPPTADLGRRRLQARICHQHRFHLTETHATGHRRGQRFDELRTVRAPYLR